VEIACLQTNGTTGDPEANLAALDRAAAEAVAHGAELLVTPEMFLTGYDLGPDTATRVRALAPGLTERVQPIAREHGLALLVGLPEVEGDDCFNTAVFVGPDGEVLGRHRKVHLFTDFDRDVFTAGDQLVSTVDFRGLRIATLICYDVEFPEAVRAAALAGAHLVAVPTAQMHPYEWVAEQLVRVRAWENQVYVAYVDHDGTEGRFDYVGRSSVIGPDGRVLASLEHGEGLVLARIDAHAVARAQRENPYLGDRRSDLY
jgi:5-aminopentanamidase